MSSISKLEKLMYSIGVIDKVTGPVNKIMGKVNQLSEKTAGAQRQITSGMIGAAAGTMMLVGALNPAIAANRALDEVSALNVAESSLQQLNKTALNFSANYGPNAADVITSSYDIQSSIAGLTGDELSAFTQASSIMAKATKSDASTATNFLGTMFGIYQDSAKALGKNTWVEQFAGQTATAVRMFKTNGNEMSSAFTSLGASAQSNGITMAESMAVLGQLQATMSGSEAGTKYRAFLAGIGKAQKQLGLQLTDAQGQLLPMADVLDQLQGRFGNIDTVAKSDALKTAFGSEEAVGLIKLLLPQIDQLRGNITELNSQTGMQTAIDMADAQTDAWHRLSGGFNAAATSLGQAILPVLEPIVDFLAWMLKGVLYLSQEFPTFTGTIAAVTVGLVGLMVAFNGIKIVMGLYHFALVSVGITTTLAAAAIKILGATLWLSRKAVMAAQGAIWLFNAALMNVGLVPTIAKTAAYIVAMGVYNGAMVAAQGATWLFNTALMGVGFVATMAKTAAYTVAMGLYKGAMIAAQAATWLFNTALLANPIGLVITAVVGLVAGVAGLVYYWDEVVAAFKNTTWAQVLMTVFDVVSKAFQGLIDGVSWLLEALGLMDGKTVDVTTNVNAQVNPQDKIEALNAKLVPGQTVVPGQYLAPGQAAVPASNVVPFNQATGSNTALQPIEKNNIVHLAERTAIKTESSASLHKLNEIAAHSETIERSKESNRQQNINNTRKVERSDFFQQLNNSSTKNSTASNDNSKRVFIDNLTLKSDDVATDFENIMELAS